MSQASTRYHRFLPAVLLFQVSKRGERPGSRRVGGHDFGAVCQGTLGRDHNPGCQTMWMAGAGIKGGQHIGASDEVGYKAAEQVIWNHDVHASLLYLLGMDHKRLTYYFNGRNMRLTDVAGELIPQIIA
jgi:hypothetical protein